MKDKTEGTWDKTKGKIKEEVGKAAGDRSAEWGGKAEQAKGELKQGIGKVKDALENKEEVAEERERAETTTEPRRQLRPSLSERRAHNVVVRPALALIVRESEGLPGVSAVRMGLATMTPTVRFDRATPSGLA